MKDILLNLLTNATIAARIFVRKHTLFGAYAEQDRHFFDLIDSTAYRFTIHGHGKCVIYYLVYQIKPTRPYSFQFFEASLASSESSNYSIGHTYVSILSSHLSHLKIFSVGTLYLYLTYIRNMSQR